MGVQREALNFFSAHIPSKTVYILISNAVLQIRHHNKNLCIRFRRIYWKNVTEMEYNIHTYVFICVQSPENKNHVFFPKVHLN